MTFGPSKVTYIYIPSPQLQDRAPFLSPLRSLFSPWDWGVFVSTEFEGSLYVIAPHVATQSATLGTKSSAVRCTDTKYNQEMLPHV